MRPGESRSLRHHDGPRVEAKAGGPRRLAGHPPRDGPAPRGAAIPSDRAYVHLGDDAPLLGTTIDACFRHVAGRHALREAVVSRPQGIRLTYAALDAAVDELARGLMALGLEAGDRVGVWSTDNAEWILLQLATARTGVVLVNISPAYRPAELRHALSLARVQALFLIPSFRSSHYVEMVRGLPRGPDGPVPDLQHVVVWDPADASSTRRPGPGWLTWPEVLERGRRVTTAAVATRAAGLDADDPINIQFTSGTTGFPKAVVLTHHNILNNGYFAAEVMRFTEADRVCVPVPFYHCFGMVVSNLGCLTHGAAIVIPSPHFEAGATLAAIEAERCTAVHGVPTMFVAELECPDFAAYDLSSLRTGIMAGAPCPPELVRRVMRDMGCGELLVGYGQTEASPITHLTRPDDPVEKRWGTVGTNLPHQEAKVIDTETGATQAHGQPGEICFRGYHVMRGYFDQPEATDLAIDEAGWLHSGDLGVIEADGYLRITGRLKDMIIRGGENVYPAEVEARLFEHPAVLEAAVFGVRDERMGEEVGAWVQLHEEADASPDDLRAFIRDGLAHFKVPRYLWLVDGFPMTVTGKIRKFRIREIVNGWTASRLATGAPGGSGRIPGGLEAADRAE